MKRAILGLLLLLLCACGGPDRHARDETDAAVPEADAAPVECPSPELLAYLTCLAWGADQDDWIPCEMAAEVCTWSVSQASLDLCDDGLVWEHGFECMQIMRD